MENINLVLLILHISGGYFALGSGFLSMASKHGQRVHRISGSLFFYSMLVVGFTALALSLIKQNTFLLHIGIFVLYQNYSGRKALLVKSLRADWLDYAIVFIAFINGLFMVLNWNVVLLVFGGLSMFLSVSDMITFREVALGKPIAKLAWLRKHIGMMIGAYIGTITAFLVVNTPPISPGWLVWLAPTFILVPLMRFWTRKYTKETLTT
jgi:hypothetical protein